MRCVFMTFERSFQQDGIAAFRIESPRRSDGVARALRAVYGRAGDAIPGDFASLLQQIDERRIKPLG